VNFINKDKSNVTEETQSTISYTMSAHRIKLLHVLQFQRECKKFVSKLYHINFKYQNN
jgi:hypothetical protein